MALTQTEAGPYRWVVITYWMISNSIGWAIALVIGILLPSISSEFQLSYTQQGLLSSSPVWIYTLLSIPLSVWLIRYRPTTLTTVTLVLGTLFIFLQASATTFAILLACRLAFGLTMAAREPTRIRLMQQWFQSREFLWVNGVTAGILSLTFSAMLVATPLFLDAFNNDWRTTLYVFGGFSTLLTILWGILGRQRVTQEDQLRNTRIEVGLLKGVLRHKELWMAGLGLLGSNLVSAAFLAFYPTYMLNRYHVSLTISGELLALTFLVCGITSFAITRIATDWKTRANILYLCGLAMPCSFVMLVSTDSFPLLVSAAIVNGLSWGFFPILLTVTFHIRDIRIQEVPVGHAFLFTNISLGLATGPVLTGFLQDTFNNLAAVLIVISLLSISVAIAGLFMGRLPNLQTSET
jgi:cyanate permease